MLAGRNINRIRISSPFQTFPGSWHIRAWQPTNTEVRKFVDITCFLVCKAMSDFCNVCILALHEFDGVGIFCLQGSIRQQVSEVPENTCAWSFRFPSHSVCPLQCLFCHSSARFREVLGWVLIDWKELLCCSNCSYLFYLIDSLTALVNNKYVPESHAATVGMDMVKFSWWDSFTSLCNTALAISAAPHPVQKLVAACACLR